MKVITSVLSIAAVIAQPFNQYAQAPPAQPAPYNPYGTQPQAPPAQPAPYNPYNPYGTGMGMGMGMPFLQSFQTLKCEYGQCLNRRITMSPTSDFKLECQQPGGCNGMTLTLNMINGNKIDELKFDSPTRGATVNINGLPGQGIELEHIRCNAPMACNGLTVNAGFGVELWNIQVNCNDPMACINCKVNGMDCNMLSLQNGNNGFMNNGFYPGMTMPGFSVQPNNPPATNNPYGPPAPPQQPQTLPAPATPTTPAQPQVNNPQIPTVPGAV